MCVCGLERYDNGKHSYQGNFTVSFLTKEKRFRTTSTRAIDIGVIRMSLN